MISSQQNRAVLLCRGPLSAQTTARLSAFFAEHSVVIKRLVQYTDGDEALLRVEWLSTEGWADETDCMAALACEFGEEGAEHFYSVRLTDTVPTVGLLCSNQTHVLVDVLKQLDTEHYPAFNVPFVISDYEAAGSVADRFGVPFFYISPTESAHEIRQRQLEIIERYKPDVLGLARYDALLSQHVIDQAKCPILSVHNAFLPSIKSEKAYSLAYEQGVKLVGATSRLVQTKTLGPIVEQSFIKLRPGITVSDVRLMGQTVELQVFVAALRKLVEHKVMVYNAKTIVFD